MRNHEIPRNIFLIGYMGTGKTTVGKKIAETLGFRFVDTDDLVERMTGRSIPEIFATEGEEAFRRLETEALLRAARLQGRVISTGGGIILRPQNRRIIRSGGYAVWLKASPEKVYERVAASNNRPLLRTENPRQTIEEMLLARDGSYEEASHFSVQTDDLTADDVAYGICESARVFFNRDD